MKHGMDFLDVMKAVARQRDDARSVASQLLQSLVLLLLRGMGPRYYCLARFWRKEVPLREQLEHYGEGRYRKAVNRLNHPAYQKASQHKVTEKAVLALHGIPTPAFFGFFHAQRGRTPEGMPLRNAQELTRALLRLNGARVCFKAAEGSGGLNFAALDVVEAEDSGVMLNHPLTGEHFSADTWAQRLQGSRAGWLLEAFLPQHAALSALNPDSLNTLRLIVMREATGFCTRGALLRIGRAGSQVDNTSGGGLACPVDIESGCIREALDMSLCRRSHTHHPDTGARLTGVNIPHWSACKALAERALAAYPNMNFAGVDVAVGERGPMVIELNVCPDRRFAAHLDMPHARLFAAGHRP